VKQKMDMEKSSM